ncbi:VanZ family protein [Pseudonocardia sediminis]|uniref:VanZ family protein n=1 Tax=Pseudonocardia sediminis TaxID=1397368 RepID=A0A4Q7UWI5_PSEST|nr:VanZ family protein [Pseudonocardia sediminis]RZT85251.1 VanZ family protein [Pseudonocardia sediminis]
MGGTRGLRRFAPLGAAIVLSLVVFFTPASGVPTAPPGTDKVIHLLVFALLAVTGRWAGLRAGPLLAGLVLYAGVSEVLQSVLPIGRDGDVLDALTDLAGALLGLLAFHLVHRTRRTTTPRTR